MKDTTLPTFQRAGLSVPMIPPVVLAISSQKRNSAQPALEDGYCSKKFQVWMHPPPILPNYALQLNASFCGILRERA